MEERWLLSPAGQMLHRPRANPLDVPVAVCDGMLVLSARRTDDHDAHFGVDRHPRCTRCGR